MLKKRDVIKMMREETRKNNQKASNVSIYFRIV